MESYEIDWQDENKIKGFSLSLVKKIEKVKSIRTYLQENKNTLHIHCMQTRGLFSRQVYQPELQPTCFWHLWSVRHDVIYIDSTFYTYI